MKWLVASIIFVAVGFGCSSGYPVDMSGESVPQPDIVLENDDYTITFPARWREVKSFSDFSGYAGGLDGSSSYAVFGKSTVYTLPDAEDDIPMFVIMEIELKDKGEMAKYPSERYLGENLTSAFYGGAADESGPWAFLYAGDSMAKYAADVDEILGSVKVK